MSIVKIKFSTIFLTSNHDIGLNDWLRITSLRNLKRLYYSFTNWYWAIRVALFQQHNLDESTTGRETVRAKRPASHCVWAADDARDRLEVNATNVTMEDYSSLSDSSNPDLQIPIARTIVAGVESQVSS